MAFYPETDKTMLERVISGDEIKWSEFYETYAPVVKMLCSVYRVPNDAAEDVVQEAMLRFSKQSGTYCYTPERAKFRTYFNRIVRGVIADWYRKNKAGDPAESDSEEFQLPAYEEEELQIWQKVVLEELLSKLSRLVSGKSYLAFTMSAVEGHSIAETAEFLQISAAQVYMARTRCIAKLRAMAQNCNLADPELALPPKGF